MIASGAGALYAASFGGWGFAYALMAALMLVGMATVWATPEPGGVRAPEPLPGATAGERVAAWLRRRRRRAVRRSVRRSGAAGLILILAFVILYKFGEAIAGTMSNPLYIALGFTKVEIATVAKIYGVIATLAGVAIGGIMVLRLGIFRALLIGGVLQALSNLMYILQVWAGHDIMVLALTIGTENLTNGIGSAALSPICRGCAMSRSPRRNMRSVLARDGRGQHLVGLGRLARR